MLFRLLDAFWTDILSYLSLTHLPVANVVASKANIAQTTGWDGLSVFGSISHGRQGIG